MLCYEFPPIGGGTGNACLHLLQEFSRERQMAIDLVTSGCGATVRRDRLSDNIDIHRLPLPKRELSYWRPGEIARWTFHALRYSRRLALQRSYDLAHCWAGWPSGLIGYRLRDLMPYIVSLRGSDVPGYSSRLRLLDPLVFRHVSRRVWGQAARVVSVSDDLRALAVRTLPGIDIDVIPNGVDAERFAPAERRPMTELLFVGRLIERKGVAYLLEAFGDLLQDYPDLALTIVGEGPERPRLEALCRRYGTSNQVQFLGFLDKSELARAYRRASIFILPSLSDAMPNVILEAMASGLAIVTTRTGAAQVVQDNGVFVDFASRASIRDAVACYLAEPARLIAHQQRSRQLAEDLSWGKVARYFFTLYDNVLLDGHRSAS